MAEASLADAPMDSVTMRFPRLLITPPHHVLLLMGIMAIATAPVVSADFAIVRIRKIP